MSGCSHLKGRKGAMGKVSYVQVREGSCFERKKKEIHVLGGESGGGIVAS